MPRLSLSLPEELGPASSAPPHGGPYHDAGATPGGDVRPRIVRWLACWAGRSGR
jgi:hypothetical protein